ncbi:GNAT family N-acetyltransferase [Halobacillus sp. BBL2006]|uniref:GNAT family N-acetyltransferase n=1 Tax=Halobacillus sp. BBL2006 TaxID=1543706 RepID=UPI00054307F6|nr:GNAT family N-acetyltransferase [Halobacillus sp. BBL2006]KHE72239.1 acetyltransferase [Halobacillus sp. BBL2006]
MQLNKRAMNEELINEIVKWEYESPYDFYNNEESEEVVKEFIEGDYSVLLDDQNRIFGYYCVGEAAKVPAGYNAKVYPEGYIDMGLGMNPEFTGQGNGLMFCRWILNDIEKSYHASPIRLSVATFNQRAIHLYGKLGFIKKDEFDTDSSRFITMTKEG